ncbi:RES family NAD+ phosphorylase [Pontiella sulfatireligans]|uniref:RES domain-containing protein n=1 Tax=Pontiella sulfatireligans TaxID=2750658 RepID=A0A6C2UIQ8_9BACT|nr:RES family NAD+ phosphorylase [Pontiella sulfatireligans]VGO20090.1 hypothetical protein SCARR_02150 [Pontiella sulfatireligans]
MPTAWRLVHKKYMHSAFSGQGARLAGGRWNAEGHAVVYTAGSLSLALLEIIVHLEFKEALKLYKAIPVDIPDSLLQSIDPAKLPDGWSASPPQPCTQFIGNCWMERLSTVALRVPSAIVPNESNYLLNPAHPEFSQIKVGEPIDLPVDPRVLERLA